MARILLTTLGSFGDLHPFLALAIGLQARGHQPVVATSEVYRQKVESEGISFFPIRPDVGELQNQPEFVQKLWDPRKGTEYLLREYVIPAVHQSYDDLLRACPGVDLILSHQITYAAPIVAEVLNIPWLSIVLQPLAFLSAYEAGVLAPVPHLHHLRALGPSLFGQILALGKRSTVPWTRPIHQLRKQAGLPPSRANLLFEGQASPFGTLALFSKHFAAPQPDWPANTLTTGFLFYDRETANLHLDSGLKEFLEGGEPPVVFTLGSSAVMHPGAFFRESLKAAQLLNVRAVLLAGRNAEQLAVPKTIHVASYAPYSELFHRASAIVHQGGIGTTSQAIRAGKPMLIVPWAHDQPDNAERIRRLGAGRTLRRDRYTASNARREISRLLAGTDYAARATALGSAIRAEDGLRAACDACDKLLA